MSPSSFGYAEFGSGKEAAKAIKKLNGAEISGRMIKLDTATPRGGGGGRGGGAPRGGRGGWGECVCVCVCTCVCVSVCESYPISQVALPGVLPEVGVAEGGVEVTRQARCSLLGISPTRRSPTPWRTCSLRPPTSTCPRTERRERKEGERENKLVWQTRHKL